jgi:hypothetical protein
MTRGRLVIKRVCLESDDTDYTLDIPTGAMDVRVAVNAAVAWRYGVESVAAPSSGMPVAASAPLEMAGSVDMEATTLHVAVSSGAGSSTYAVLACIVPRVR